MGLEIRKQRDGSPRPEWYGRFEVRGERFCVNLGVKIKGNPPKSLSLKETGDLTYELSRQEAQKELDNLVKEARSNKHANRVLETLYEAKTGESVPTILIQNLIKEWDEIDRESPICKRWRATCHAKLRRFIEFIKQYNDGNRS